MDACLFILTNLEKEGLLSKERASKIREGIPLHRLFTDIFLHHRGRQEKIAANLNDIFNFMDTINGC